MRASRRKDKEPVDPSVGRIGRIFAAVALWAVTYVTAIRLLSTESPSTASRATAVILGVGGLLPWVWTAGRAIASQDEFTQRIHYVALSCSFAATGVFLFAVDLLTQAHFIDYVSYMHIWMFMVSAWFLSIVLATRYYR